MKHILFIIFFFASIFANAEEPLKLGVITDTHFLSDKLMQEGTALDNYISSSGKNVRYSSQVIDKVLTEYSNSKIDVLLITGDLIKDGEKQSHLDLSQKLAALQNKGIKIFVIPGNHDINMNNAVGFEGDKTYSVSGITPNQFANIYKDYGFSNTLSRDTASLSYVAQLNTDTWLLAIDAAKYQEKTTSSGRILPSTEKWMTDVLANAKKENKLVIAMMHWGVTEHIMHQSEFFGNYLIDDWKRVSALLANNGVKIIFTGHFHANDITMYQSPEGNKLYDIETGTLSSYPYAYRFVDLYKNKMDVTTQNITSIDQAPNLAEDSKQILYKIAGNQAKGKLKKIGFDLPEFLSQPLTEAIAKIFISHLGGDEKMDDEMQSILQGLSFILNNQGETEDMNIDLDFFPADNNVTIDF